MPGHRPGGGGGTQTASIEDIAASFRRYQETSLSISEWEEPDDIISLSLHWFSYAPLSGYINLTSIAAQACFSMVPYTTHLVYLLGGSIDAC